ncbi:hypothetical protein FV219_00410 [Methylobacterium sp. WL122]|nr:hypothetical protein FV219_00410 [Methylobacterium sp. WL122]
MKLRGTPIHPTLVTHVSEVALGIARLRPHVLIVSQAFIDAAPSLAAVFAKRFSELPVLVVNSRDGTATTHDWQVLSFGGVGVVDKDKLLEGRALPRVIIELALEAMKVVHPKRG